MADADLEGRTRKQQLVRDVQRKQRKKVLGKPSDDEIRARGGVPGGMNFQGSAYGGGYTAGGGSGGERRQKNTEWLHNTLLTLGFVPGLGEPFDLLDALVYALEGKGGDAALAAAGAIPFIGVGARGKQAVKQIDKFSDAVNDALAARKAGAKNADELTQTAEDLYNGLPKQVKKGIAEVQQSGPVKSAMSELPADAGARARRSVMKADDAARSTPTRRAADSVEDLEYNKWLRDQPADARCRANLPEGVQRRLNKLDEKTGRSRHASRQADEYISEGGTTQLATTPVRSTEVVPVTQTSTIKTLGKHVPRDAATRAADPTGAVPYRPTAGGPRQMKEVNPTTSRTITDTRSQGSSRAEEVLARRQRSRGFGGPNEVIPSGARRQGNEVIPAGARRQGNEVIPSGARRVEGRVVEPSPYGQRLMRGAKVTGALAGAGVTAKAIKDMTSAGSGAAMQFEMGKGGLQVPQDAPEGHQKMMYSAATNSDPAITTQPVGHSRMVEYQPQPTSNIPVEEMKNRLPRRGFLRSLQEESQDKTSSMLEDALNDGKGFRDESKPPEGGQVSGQRGKEIAEREAARRRQEQALAARRAKGTGKPRGAGLAFLRTPDEVLNRIEEGQKSIQDSTVPREQALSRARKRMEMTRASQRGQEQFYRDIAEGPRVGRPNPYKVKSPPDSRGFETEADAERIRTIDGGKYASILEEDKKKRRTRTNLLRRRR